MMLKNSRTRIGVAVLVLFVGVVAWVAGPVAAIPGGACKACAFQHGIAFCVAENGVWGYDTCWIQTVLGEDDCITSGTCIVDDD